MNDMYLSSALTISNYNIIGRKIIFDQKIFKNTIMNNSFYINNNDLTKEGAYFVSSVALIENCGSGQLGDIDSIMLNNYLKSKKIINTDINNFDQTNEYINDFYNIILSDNDDNESFEGKIKTLFLNVYNSANRHFVFSSSRSIYKSDKIDSLNSKLYLEKYFDNNSGLCAGFSILWLVCMINSFSNNSAKFKNKYDSPFDNMETLTIEWFHSSAKKIMESYKENIDKDNLLQDQEVKKYIKLVQNLFKVGNSNLRHDNFFALKIEHKGVLNSKLAEFISSISKTVKDHLCLYIGTHAHAMAIYLQKHENYLRIYFYDPNLKNGDYGFNVPINRNIEHIISQNIDFTKSSELVSDNNLSLFIFAFDKKTLNKKMISDDSSIDPIKLFKYNNWKNDPILASQALRFLSAYDNYFLVNYLIKNVPQIDPNFEENGIVYSLAAACQNGHLLVVKELLKHPKIDINKPGVNGCLPLQVAIVQQNIQIIKELINHPEIDPNAVDLAQTCALSVCYPIYIAVMRKNSEILSLLLSHKEININNGRKLGDGTYETPLSLAEKNGDQGCINLLKAYLKNTNQNKRKNWGSRMQDAIKRKFKIYKFA